MLASTLLGLDPPVLPVATLVATAGLFGISEGAARVALSRMVAAGEAETDNGGYRLSGELLDRQRRQGESRAARRKTWKDGWVVVTVSVDRRVASARTDLRSALVARRLGKLREGTWLRPDNLGPILPLPPPLADHCTVFTGARLGPDESDIALARRLWDLDAWSATARSLRDGLASTLPDLRAGDHGSLAPGFVLSAAVLRHLQADPLLPDALLSERWPGAALRANYDEWDRAYRSVLADWHRTQRRYTGGGRSSD